MTSGELELHKQQEDMFRVSVCHVTLFVLSTADPRKSSWPDITVTRLTFLIVHVSVPGSDLCEDAELCIYFYSASC